MKKVIRQYEGSKLESAFVALLAFVLVFSLAFTPGSFAFAGDEGEAATQEAALVEEVVEAEAEEATEAEPLELTEEEGELEEVVPVVADKDAAQEATTVESEDADALAKKAASAAVPAAAAKKAAKGGSIGTLGTSTGTYTSSNRNGIIYELYDDFTAVAIGLDYSTKENGIGWSFTMPTDGMLNVPVDPSNLAITPGSYKIVAVADDFNLDKDTGKRTAINLVRIAPTVQSIGARAFLDGYVGNFNFLSTTGDLKTIGEKAFYNCKINTVPGGNLVFPDGLEVIGDYAFAAEGDANALSITGTVTLPNTLKEIGDSAFRHAYAAFDFNFGPNLKKIGDEAFKSTKIDSANPSLVFPDGLEYIGNKAFSGLQTVVGTIEIPDSVTYIGSEAFLGLKSDAGFKRQKLAGVSVNFPPVPGEDVYLPNGFEGVVTSDTGEIALGKSAEWTNEDLSEALITINYGEQLATRTKLDIVFVLDNSGSMTWSTDVESGGKTYTYPRMFLMEDIMHDAIDQLLAAPGYDIRVGMAGFSSGSAGSSGWTTGSFSTSASDLKNKFTENPHAYGGTQYKLGINSAIDMIDGRTDAEKADRQAVVIFLSDGLPNEGHEGLEAAQELRDKNISLFPMGVYVNDLDEGTPAEAEAALKAISTDKNTAYMADTTSEFEKIMEEVIIRSVTTLGVAIEDVMSEFFIVDNVTDASSESGTCELVDNKVIWNLAGEAKGKLHTLKIKVKLKDEHRSQADPDAILETNAALKSVDENGDAIIEATEQPELYRGVVQYVFESGTEGVALPADINNYLPSANTGYNKDQKVNPNEPTAIEYTDTVNDGVWTFVEWDKDEVTVGSGDVLFTGSWVFTKNVPFDPGNKDPDPKPDPTPTPTPDDGGNNTQITQVTQVNQNSNTGGFVPKTGDSMYLPVCIAFGVVALLTCVAAAVARRKRLNKEL